MYAGQILDPEVGNFVYPWCLPVAGLVDDCSGFSGIDVWPFLVLYVFILVLLLLDPCGSLSVSFVILPDLAPEVLNFLYCRWFVDIYLLFARFTIEFPGIFFENLVLPKEFGSLVKSPESVCLALICCFSVSFTVSISFLCLILNFRSSSFLFLFDVGVFLSFI